VENRPSRGWYPRIDLRELWAYRELAWALAQRDFKLRYAQTVFGVAWAFIQPLAAALIFTVVFGRLVDVPSDGIPYPVFAYASLTLWFYVANAVGAAAESLVEHSRLVSKVYFPRLIAPFASLFPGLVDLAVSLAIAVGFMAAYDVRPHASVVFLPLWLLFAFAIALAVGLWLCALNVLYRDVRYALGVLIQLWLFVSPVVFPSSLVDGAWRYVFALNPMAAALDGFRWSMLGGPAPRPDALVSVVMALMVLAGGLVYFRRVERAFADRI
jgi:lipopolysaccharide transport system permease protein